MILKNKYQEVWIDNNNTLVFRWLPSTEAMKPNEYIEELKTAAEIIAKQKPKHILLLTKEMRYMISLSQHNEVNEILLPVYNSSGVEKLAVVVPEDMVTTLSIQQVILEKKSFHNFKTHFFSNEKEAIDWLLEE